jgi:hypothetical protein
LKQLLFNRKDKKRFRKTEKDGWLDDKREVVNRFYSEKKKHNHFDKEREKLL